MLILGYDVAALLKGVFKMANKIFKVMPTTTLYFFCKVLQAYYIKLKWYSKQVDNDAFSKNIFPPTQYSLHLKVLIQKS